MTAPLLGTVSVTNGSSTVTFSQSQGIAQNQFLVFAADATNTIYTVPLGISGTSGTISPPYAGTTNGSTTASIPYAPTPYQKGGVAPYAFFANLAAQWPGCDLHVPIAPHMTTACLQAIADEMAPYLLANSIVWCEQGDEHWNSPFPLNVHNFVYGELLPFIDVGATLNWPGSSAAPYYKNQGAVLGTDQTYALMSAQQHDILQAQFDTHNKGIKVGRFFGSQYGNNQVATNMINFGKESPDGSGNGVQRTIPMGGIAVAPYIQPNLSGVNNNAPDSVYTAWALATGGAAPVPAILEWYKHLLKYSMTLNGFLSGAAAAIAGYGGPTGVAGQVNGKPASITYEGTLQQIDPSATAILEHDCFYHPDMVDCYTAYLQSLQDGGIYLATLFTLGGQWANQLWSIILYQQQQPGNGVGNLMGSTQGGSPGDGLCHDITNTSPELYSVRSWFAAANGGGSTPPAIRSSIRRVSPIEDRPEPLPASSRRLTLPLGVGTSWTSGSTASITNSITGTTDVIAGTLTVISSTQATLSSHDRDRHGTFTITIDGATSPCSSSAPAPRLASRDVAVRRAARAVR